MTTVSAAADKTRDSTARYDYFLEKSFDRLQTFPAPAQAVQQNAGLGPGGELRRWLRWADPAGRP
jgi:hypothetical protein